MCSLCIYVFSTIFRACSWHSLYILLVDSFFVSAKHFDIIQTPLYKVKFQTNAKRALASIHQATPVFRRFSVSFYNYFIEWGPFFPHILFGFICNQFYIFYCLFYFTLKTNFIYFNKWGLWPLSISYHCFINLIRPANKLLSKTKHYKNRQICMNFCKCLLYNNVVYMHFLHV